MTAIQYVLARRARGHQGSFLGWLAVVFVGWCAAVGGITFGVIAGAWLRHKRAAK